MSQLKEFLHGIKIVDLSHYLPGPIASLMLGDMGARVIKVVPPSGDGLHSIGPRDSHGEAIFHTAVNEGKLELRLDLKKEEDKAVLRDLAAVSDVFIEGFRPGAMARLGFSTEALRTLNPRLIVCSISAYGAQGPTADAAAHDANILASSGIYARNVECMFDPPIVDGAAALFAALSITAALYHRQQNNGAGCSIDIGLSDVMMPLQACQIAAFAKTGWDPKPESYYINGGLACYNHYRTSDGQRLILGALELKFWRNFCQAAERPDWESRHGEEEPQTRLTAEVRAYFGTLTAEECTRRFGAADCCLTPVLELRDAMRLPQIRHRNLVRQSGDTLQALYPAYIDGKAPETRLPLRQVTAEEALHTFL